MSLNYEISETNGIVNHDFLTISSLEVSFVFYFKVLLLNKDFRRSLIVLKIKSIGHSLFKSVSMTKVEFFL